MHKTEYFDATVADLETFKDYIAYGLHSNKTVLKINSDITFRTLVGTITAIQEFYRWFDGYVSIYSPQTSAKKKSRVRFKASRGFKYGMIYDKSADEFIDIEHMRLKPSGYKKHWLTNSEITTILEQFNTVRDKSIFMLLCEGMRIDEVLSVKYSSYNAGELTLKPSRSKGRPSTEEDLIRTVAFHDIRTGHFLDKYITTERADVESDLGDYLEWMFLNLKKRQNSYGKAVKYRNWWGVLKTAVEKTGIDSSEVATHVGRRTFVQGLLEAGENHETIRQLVGWASLAPLENYRNLRSKVIIKNAAEKARRRVNMESRSK